MEDALDSLDAIYESALEQVRDAMEIACLNTVNMARQAGQYTDRTGNLRSSIGFMIKDHGQIVAENFQTAGAGTTNGGKGMAKARALADSVSTMYGDQLVAVLVAGEDYALYVESRGFDVIGGSMLHFADRFNEYFSEAGGNSLLVKVKKGVGNK